MNIEQILGSRARVRILRALYERDGVSGRNLSARAGVSPSSGKAALDELVETGLVLQTRERGQHCYELNRSHALCDLLGQVFALETRLLHRVAARLEPLLRGEKAGPLRACGLDPANRVCLLVTHPVEADSSLLGRVERMLWYTFGLRLDRVVHDPADFRAGGQVWVAPAALERLEEGERRRFLEFFNVNRREGL